MNYRNLFHQLAVLLLVLSGTSLLLGGWSALETYWGFPGEQAAAHALLATSSIGIVISGIGWILTRRASASFGRREALLLVALSWLLGAALAALPYLIWARISEVAGDHHPFRSFVDCYFESMSGLTTTGATVLSDIESLPRGILLWRALTHWVGGLGIVVLFVAVLPSLGVSGKKMYRVEAPGPSPDGFSPQIRDTARGLWYIYLALTILQTLLLMVAGLDWHDALCHTFASLATGGFSTRNASVGAYDSAVVNVIIIVFMVLAGMNFGLFYQLFKGKAAHVWRDTEMRLYLLILLVGSGIVAVSLLNQRIVTTTGEERGPDAVDAIQQGVFTTVSIQTTTGFCTSDFHRWPEVAKIVLVTLMIIGGCSGSTAGGIKVIRLWITLKVMAVEIERAFRPKVMRPVKVGTAALDDDQKLGNVVYVLGIAVLVGAGTIAVQLFESHSKADFATCSTAAIATLCTIGPGLGAVGAIENYGWLTSSSKLVLSLLMVLGRLEIYAVAVLFTPRFWRGH